MVSGCSENPGLPKTKGTGEIACPSFSNEFPRVREVTAVPGL